VQSSAAFHENIGWHRRCFAGFARIGDHRSRAASGGLVTWCLDSLLNNGLVDKTSVVGLSPEAGARGLTEGMEGFCDSADRTAPVPA
jgi:coenzyme F420-reducing hydrogenase beta subunit